MKSTLIRYKIPPQTVFNVGLFKKYQNKKEETTEIGFINVVHVKLI